MNYNMTEGSITGKLLKFAFPLMIGNVLQQLYNLADTIIVGIYLGEEALGAVGSSYTLMVFITSILIGLCMGSSAFFSIRYGNKDYESLKQGFFISFVSIGAVAVIMNILVYAGLDVIIAFLRVPKEVTGLMKEYMIVINAGIMGVFLYNFFSNLLRSIGNSVIPLIFLGASAIINIVLDLVFVVEFEWGVGGAALATIIAQYISGFGIVIYYLLKCPELRVKRRHMHWDRRMLSDIAGLSGLTCLQQSIMNFGILMVQGLVNSFGSVVMAAFAVAVKIDTLAYSPVQDFGNAFSTYVAQNYGAGKTERIRRGMRSALCAVLIFCLCISALVCVFAEPLMEVFLKEGESAEIVKVGAEYLRIEGSFYVGIGILFLLYGFYRAMNRPGMSVVLTVISLGSRVLLAYTLSAIPELSVTGIWLSVPIGWALADITGACLYKRAFKIKA